MLPTPPTLDTPQHPFAYGRQTTRVEANSTGPLRWCTRRYCKHPPGQSGRGFETLRRSRCCLKTSPRTLERTSLTCKQYFDSPPCAIRPRTLFSWLGILLPQDPAQRHLSLVSALHPSIQPASSLLDSQRPGFSCRNLWYSAKPYLAACRQELKEGLSSLTAYTRPFSASYRPGVFDAAVPWPTCSISAARRLRSKPSDLPRGAIEGKLPGLETRWSALVWSVSRSLSFAVALCSLSRTLQVSLPRTKTGTDSLIEHSDRMISSDLLMDYWRV